MNFFQGHTDREINLERFTIRLGMSRRYNKNGRLSSVSTRTANAAQSKQRRVAARRATGNPDCLAAPRLSSEVPIRTKFDGSISSLT